MNHKWSKYALCGALYALNFAPFGHAQFGRGGGDWMAAGGDAQRTASVRTDPQISVEKVQGGVMQSLWKLKLNGTPSAPVVDEPVPESGFDTLPATSVVQSGDGATLRQSARMS